MATGRVWVSGAALPNALPVALSWSRASWTGQLERASWNVPVGLDRRSALKCTRIDPIVHVVDRDEQWLHPRGVFTVAWAAQVVACAAVSARM